MTRGWISIHAMKILARPGSGIWGWCPTTLEYIEVRKTLSPLLPKVGGLALYRKVSVVKSVLEDHSSGDCKKRRPQRVPDQPSPVGTATISA